MEDEIRLNLFAPNEEILEQMLTHTSFVRDPDFDNPAANLYFVSSVSSNKEHSNWDIHGFARQYYNRMKEYAPEFFKTLYPLIPDTHNWWERYDYNQNSYDCWEYHEYGFEYDAEENDDDLIDAYEAEVSKILAENKNQPSKLERLSIDVISTKMYAPIIEGHKNPFKYYQLNWDNEYLFHIQKQKNLRYVLDLMRLHYGALAYEWAYVPKKYFDYMGHLEWISGITMPNTTQDVVFEFCYRYTRMQSTHFIHKQPILGA